MLSLVIICTVDDHMRTKTVQQSAKIVWACSNINFVRFQVNVRILIPDVPCHLSNLELTQAVITQNVANDIMLLDSLTWPINERESDSQTAQFSADEGTP